MTIIILEDDSLVGWRTRSTCTSTTRAKSRRSGLHLVQCDQTVGIGIHRVKTRRHAIVGDLISRQLPITVLVQVLKSRHGIRTIAGSWGATSYRNTRNRTSGQRATWTWGCQLVGLGNKRRSLRRSGVSRLGPYVRLLFGDIRFQLIDLFLKVRSRIHDHFIAFVQSRIVVFPVDLRGDLEHPFVAFADFDLQRFDVPVFRDEDELAIPYRHDGLHRNLQHIGTTLDQDLDAGRQPRSQFVDLF